MQNGMCAEEKNATNCIARFHCVWLKKHVRTQHKHIDNATI